VAWCCSCPTARLFAVREHFRFFGVIKFVAITSDQRREWTHFALSAVTMLILAGFTVWRAAVTAWRPTADRFYFFPNNTWLGSIDQLWLAGWLSRIDHSWLNDFLLGPGTVACFFVAFTAMYAAGGLFYQNSGGILSLNGSLHSDSSWADHKRLMHIILWGLLVRALIEGWGEEVGVFPSRFIFDPWDLSVELGGIVIGAWIVYSLSYPLFSKVPHFPPRESDMPGESQLSGKFAIDVVSVIVTGIYIFIVNPFEIRPLTLVERQTLCLEIAIVFIAFREGLKRGIHPSPGSKNGVVAQLPHFS
jgi:hypothetical protein